LRKARREYIFHGFENIKFDDIGLDFASEPALLWRRDMNLDRQLCRLKCESTGFTAVSILDSTTILLSMVSHFS
jgi:hypothetical protein